MKKLNCFIDGNALCVVDGDFIDLQESATIFIDLTEEELAIIKSFKPPVEAK